MATRKVEWKVFPVWAWEREADWLNAQAQRGWALVRVGLCRYEFEPCEPGAYQYCLQALDCLSTDEKNADYIDFVESTGAEKVDSMLYWVYFRRKAEDTPFELFSDCASRIRHIRRIQWVLLMLLLANVIGLLNLAHLVAREGALTLLMLLLEIGVIMLLVYGLARLQEGVRRSQRERDTFNGHGDPT